MATIGSWLIPFALLFAVYGAVVGAIGTYVKRDRLWWSAQGAAASVALMLTGAVAALEYLLVSSNFRVLDVADETSRGLPLFYKLTALWSGNAGSLLFWVWILSMYTAFIALRRHRDGQELVPYAVPVLLSIETFFLGIEVFVLHPFTLLAAPAYDGNGLSPLLQNVWMVIHPPNLYLGYIGLSVPFAFAIAALWKRQVDAAWLRITRRWTLTAWLFLTMGLLLGGYWAYVELGWGGYWAWDPVENAALVPWLVASAFLHSGMVQQRRGMFKGWNIGLIITAWLLTIFGTMMTRSGIVDSIHAFTGTGLVPEFSVFLLLAIAVSAYLILTRRSLFTEERRLHAVVSRETAFLVNNLLLLGAMLAIMWGSLFPIVSQYLLGQAMTVQTSYFDAVMAPVGLLIVLLMGAGPAVSWGASSPRLLLRRLLLPLIVGVAGGLLVASVTPKIYGIAATGADVGLGAVFFAITAIVQEVLHARHGAGTGPARGFFAQILKNRQRFGGYVVHVGLAFLVVGIIGSFYYTQKETVALTRGQTVTFGGYHITYAGNEERIVGENIVIAANLYLSDGSHLAPAQVLYPGSAEPIARVGIHTTLLGDVYTVLNGVTSSNSADILIILNPLVIWIWIGGLVIVAGTLFALGVGEPEPASRFTWEPAPLRDPPQLRTIKP